MTDSAILARMTAARSSLKAYNGSSRKVVVDITDLTHAQVGELLFGGRWGQLRMLVRYCIAMAMAICPFPDFKNSVFRAMGVRIGRNVYISPLVYIDVTRPDLLQIGNNVMIGMGTALAVHERNMEVLALGRVTIGDGVTVGGQCLIRCGVTLGNGSTVDAHSSVSRDLKPGEPGTGERQIQQSSPTSPFS